MNYQVSCPGKINLFLDVMGKQKNGYHEILTLFLPVHGVEDKVTLTESPSLQILCQNPDVPQDSSNLCWQAAAAFADAARISPDWKIEIEKNLPVAGGMGGGSSNAGRLLSLLQAVYPEKVSTEKLGEIALSIGADVPFFLNPIPSLATGVGEKLILLKSKKQLHLLLVTFSFPVSAAWAYSNRTGPFKSSGLSPEAVREKWDSGKVDEIIYNDLGLAVEHKFPIIKGALEDLKKAGASNAIVSGSGPTVFGLFKNRSAVEGAIKKLTESGYPLECLLPVTAG